MAIDPEALYIQLGRLVETMPNLFEPLPYPRSTLEWMGQVDALIQTSDDIADLAAFRTYASSLSQPVLQLSAANDLSFVLYRALAKAELKAPATARGSFIPAGNAFDAMAALGNILGPPRSLHDRIIA